MIFYRSSVLLAALLFLFINNGYGDTKIPDSSIVAKYDNEHWITAKELNKYIQDRLYYKKFEKRKDIYTNALNDMLVHQLKRMDFFDKGLDKDSQLIKNISRILNEELVAEYFKVQYEDKYANEEYAKKIYRTIDKEVHYQLIELTKPQYASPNQIDSLQAKTLAIKSEIENGKDFSLFVKRYSQNNISVTNKGYMPPVDWKQSLSDSVYDIIFNLNKNDIRIINSNNAFLIVKITDINKIHVEPFDLIKKEIITELKNGYINLSQDDYEKDKKELIDENNLSWNQTALEQIIQWSNIPDFYKGGYQNIIQDALANGDNKVILNYKGGILDYKEFLRLLNNILVMKNSYNVKEDEIKKFILEAIRTDLIVKKADSLNLKRNIFNAYTTNEEIKNQIVRLYNQAEIEEKIPVASEEALRQYFKENENTQYYHLEKRNIFLIVFSDKDEAGKAAQKIKEGIPFEKITGSYLVKTYIKQRDGEIKSYLNDEIPIFSEAAFSMKESEISEPLKFEDENGLAKYAIIKCYSIRPEKQLTFNDVKDNITEDYKSYHRKIIENKTVEELKSKYHPVINEDVLAKLINPN